ncbi:uncharacterized protein [Watersipora subatra]|uniref:uncharacterized protein isoform X2 n=1 Tax=Watersipora subatra TaxID=2589382 RepID=UPI00355B52B3
MSQSVNCYNFDPSEHQKGTSTQYACSICTKDYNYVQCLKRHVLSVHINRAYVSPSDLSTFDLQLDDHHERTLVPKMYTCNACKMLCTNRDNLSKHLASQHLFSADRTTPERVTVIQCPDCGIQFTKMSSLNCHMRYHRNGWTANGRLSSNLTGVESSPTAPISSPPAHAITKASSSQLCKNHSSRSQSSMRLTVASKRRGKDLSASIRLSKTEMVSYPIQRGKCKTSAQNKSMSKMAKMTQRKSTRSRSNNLVTRSDLNADAQVFSKGRQLRQRTSMQKIASVFTCTVCRKPFHSYGNMLRHRRLSHELAVRKRPDIHMRRKAKHRSIFSDPKKARKYFNKVASNIAFNMKNCIHGNAKHLTLSSNCIRAESKTNLRELRANVISKKSMKLYNIKTKSSASLNKISPKVAASAAKDKQLKSEEQMETMKVISQESKSPDVYDKPGLWKYLCLVCLQYFPNTLELFTHQDSIHKRISVGYMEVGKSSELPLHSVATLRPRGCVPASSFHDLVSAPPKYTCTKCHAQFNSSAELHPHIVTCGKALFTPLQIRIPHMPFPELTHDNTYGKVKGKKMHWQRGDVSQQKKLTDIDGFNVRKRKKKRLVMEVKEQERLERLRAMSGLSPGNWGQSLDGEVETQSVHDEKGIQSESNSNTDPHSHERSYKFKYSCPYCTITFKYRKVYQKHVNSKCEMLKRISSPDKSETASEELTLSDAVTVKEEPVVEKVSKGDLDDYWSPQKSLAQARVLAKFIHPARTCGPCYACKKPNMARRYSHLQQRSEAFVEFVMSKCKNICLQSCICKACELNFKHEYDKRKEKIEKNILCGRVHRKGESKKLLHPSISAEVKVSTTATQKPSNVKSRTSAFKTSKMNGKVLQPKLNSDFRTVHYRTRSKCSFKEQLSAATALGNRSSTKPMQSKSLEQIFPEDEKGCDGLSRSQLTLNSVHSASDVQSRAAVSNLHLENDIIDVEKEMIMEGQKVNMSKKVVQKGLSNDPAELYARKIMVLGDKMAAIGVKPASCDHSTYTSTPASGIIDGLDALDTDDGERFRRGCAQEAAEQAQNDARLKVILQFVKDSTNSKRFVEGKKLSLTEIIDAVTEKVKEDPRLARTLTDAIEAACDSSRTLTSLPVDSGKLHASKSLPAVLDKLSTTAGYPSSHNILRTGYISDTLQPYQHPQTASAMHSPSIAMNQQIDKSTSKSQQSDSYINSPCAFLESCVTPDIVLPNTEKAFVTRVDSATIVSGSKHPYSLVSDSSLQCDPNDDCQSENEKFDNGTHSNATLVATKARKHQSSDSVSNCSKTSSSNIPHGIACGDIDPSESPHLDDDLQSINSLETAASQGSDDFMLDNYGCIETAELAGPSNYPKRNLRLENLIYKLSCDSKVDRKQSVGVSIPTNLQNPNSIDSGFISLAD